MRILTNMKLSRMVTIVAIVPILAMMMFSAQIVLREIETSKATSKLGQLTALAVKLSDLVHEQQKERGATAVYVGSSGKKFASELTLQRQQTNHKRDVLKAYLSDFQPDKYGAAFNRDFQAVLVTLGKMDDIRNSVDTLSISTQAAISYYTGLNGQNLKLVEFMGRLSSNAMIVSRFVSFSNFLQSKERAGIERAIGANGFTVGKFTPQAMDRFKRLITSQETYNEVFLTQATSQQKVLFNDVMSSDVANEVQRMREVAFAGGLEGNLEGVTGKMWFDTITQKINGLKGIEDSLSANLLNQLAKLEAAAVLSNWTAIGTAVLALAIVIALCLLIIRSINASFKTIIAAMTSLAGGNLDAALPPPTTNEIGEMVKCVQVFKDNAIAKVALEQQQAEAEKEREVEKRQMMQKLADDFDTNVGSIIAMVSSASSELSITAQSMAGVAEETSCQATAVATASQQASSNVQTVAAASEEMTTSISEINKQMVQASQASKKAVETVEATGEQIANLAETANKIGDVVSMISDIAAQTNLLALNATIESARAGEAGKGFAVVASEVKELASQTAQATDGINRQIEEIQSSTKQAVVSMENIRIVIGSLDETSGAIAAAMEEQGATTHEISRNIQEAAKGTTEVTNNISGVTQAAQEAGSASSQVTSAAEELSRQSAALRTEVDRFIAQVRTG